MRVLTQLILGLVLLSLEQAAGTTPPPTPPKPRVPLSSESDYVWRFSLNCTHISCWRHWQPFLSDDIASLERRASGSAASTPEEHYASNASLLRLPSVIRVPTPADCTGFAPSRLPFFAVTMYSAWYADKARRFTASCAAAGVCCNATLVPQHAFTEQYPHVVEPRTGRNGNNLFRLRLIASKPLFVLRVLESSWLPVAWLDVDLEFRSYPTLFTPAGWESPRDVLVWNWAANVSRGRRLKTASGIFWFNQTRKAHALARAWAEVMACDDNSFVADDQALDLVVNGDGWIDRVSFGWLPAAYLYMRRRHAHLGVVPTVEHDRGVSPGLHQVVPVAPHTCRRYSLGAR